MSYIDTINEEITSVAIDANRPVDEIWKMKCGAYHVLLRTIIKRNKVKTT